MLLASASSMLLSLYAEVWRRFSLCAMCDAKCTITTKRENQITDQKKTTG